VGRIGSIDPRRCREHVEANFDVPVMVEAYLRLYRQILGAPLAEKSPAMTPPAFYAKDSGATGTAVR